MNNTLTFFIFFTIFSVGLITYITQSVRKILSKTELTQKLIKKSKKWGTATATINAISINVDYPWPNNSFRGDEIPDIERKRNDSYKCEVIGGVQVEYVYEWNSVQHTNSTIQIIPTPKILNFAIERNVGDSVPVYINPKNPSESYLIQSEEDDVGEYTWMLLQDLRAPLSLCIGTTLISILLLAAI